MQDHESWIQNVWIPAWLGFAGVSAAELEEKARKVEHEQTTSTVGERIRASVALASSLDLDLAPPLVPEPSAAVWHIYDRAYAVLRCCAWIRMDGCEDELLLLRSQGGNLVSAMDARLSDVVELRDRLLTQLG